MMPRKYFICALGLGIGTSLWLLAVTFAHAQQQDPPTATTTQLQNVRAMGHLGAPVLEILTPGQRVLLHARLPDNSWVDVTTPKGTKGWMYRPYLQVDDRVVAALPSVGQDYLLPMPGMPDAPASTPPPMPSPDPSATTDAIFRPESDVQVSATVTATLEQQQQPSGASRLGAPPALPVAAPAPGSTPVPLAITICIDLNKSQVCDPGEGVQGVPLVVMDTTTDQVVATAVTDAAGRARFTASAPPNAALVVNAPTLAWSQAVQVTTGDAGTVAPPAIQHIEPLGNLMLPWPLP
jgi:hypothetical protein